MRQIYLNYAATSPRTSPAVTRELCRFLGQNLRLNAGRNFEGIEDGRVALRARMAICKLFGTDFPERVIFTSGATASLNMILKGLLEKGGHIIASGVEHNAVMRPLEQLRKKGAADYTLMSCSPDGAHDPESLEDLIRPNTRAIVMTHASNVLGTVLPVGECFAKARRRGIFTILDASQTAGVYPLFFGGDTDALVFPGHKGLRGLAGVGGFVLSEAASEQIEPWLSGGTGSVSQYIEMPSFLPDKFEPGTMNTLGILSIALAVEEILEIGVEAIRSKEMELTSHFLEECQKIPRLRLHGSRDASRSVAVVSVDVPGRDAGAIAASLFEEHEIITRSGLHCSPRAHQAAGTFPCGTVRFSFGYETTREEIDTALSALCAVLKT
ncbi:MAG: aminotransferase class V-fold PLP-dependent enzyme [Synergistaceae bacterium]|jgi:cysteine desulfurase family protein|nr:aminotransferase class V-fold PLP-dependent enzyme [Synergistaceae bacterium]